MAQAPSTDMACLIKMIYTMSQDSIENFSKIQKEIASLKAETSELRAGKAISMSDVAISENDRSRTETQANGLKGITDPTLPLEVLNLSGSKYDKLSKAIRLVNAVGLVFDPHTEKEYDDILKSWETKLTSSAMYDLEIIKQMIPILASDRVHDHLQLMDQKTPWAEYKNILAKSLYKFTSQIDDLDDELHSKIRLNSAHEAIKFVKTRLTRLQMLSIRHNRKMADYEPQAKRYILNKLPINVSRGMLDKPTDTMTLENFIDAIIRKEYALNQLNSLDNMGLSVSSNNITMDVPMPQVMANRTESDEGPICFRCKQRGHIARRCPVKCDKCGKLGHAPENCYKVETNRQGRHMCGHMIMAG